MAYRPIYISTGNIEDPFKEELIRFDWVDGLTYEQKCKRRDSLKESIKRYYDINTWLEVSTKSDKEIGVLLSAKNLLITLSSQKKYPVENIYQFSKVISKGKVIGYNFHGKEYPINPYGLFYDYLYMMALYQNKELHEKIKNYLIFTDIEYNQYKQLNTQARAIAIFKTLLDNNEIDILNDNKEFFKYYEDNVKLTRIK